MLQCTGWAGAHASETSESLSPLCGNPQKSPVVPPELCSWAGWSVVTAWPWPQLGLAAAGAVWTTWVAGGLSENRSQVGVYL